LILGILGILYGFRVLSHARQSTYKPDIEDRIWYLAAPFGMYAALTVSGGLLIFDAEVGLVAAGVTTLLFVLLGLRNAWDTVTYIATRPPADSHS
jgi:hypothetical protein